MAASGDRDNERAASSEAEEEEKTDGWLTTYADMVTLLLTFFVLMVALSSTDTERMELFMMALTRDGLTAEQFWEIQDRFNPDDFDPDDWDEMFPHPETTDIEEKDHLGAAAMQELHDAMKGYIEEEELGEVMFLSFNGDFLLITLASDILFDSGRADITPEMEEKAHVIAGMLAATFEPEDPFEIVVTGHTDNVPINTPQFPSNWYLSNTRAANFLSVLISESELPPWFFYTRACGQYRPIATNETPEGRQMNRRVEVMVTLARANPAWESEESLQIED